MKLTSTGVYVEQIPEEVAHCSICGRECEQGYTWAYGIETYYVDTYRIPGVDAAFCEPCAYEESDRLSKVRRRELADIEADYRHDCQVDNDLTS